MLMTGAMQGRAERLRILKALKVLLAVYGLQTGFPHLMRINLIIVRFVYFRNRMNAGLNSRNRYSNQKGVSNGQS